MSIEDTQERIYEKVLKFVSIQDRTEEETRQRISHYLRNYKKLSNEDKENVAENILERLKEIQIIDDEKYSQNFIKSQEFSSRPKPPQQLKNYLFKKGLPQNLISKIIQSSSGVRNDEIALRLLEKKSTTFSRYNGQIKRQKAFKFLLGKGFSFDTAKNAFDKVYGVK